MAYQKGDTAAAKVGGLALQARLRAERAALRAENVQLHAALDAIGAALVEHADDYPRAVGAVRGLLGRLADRRPIAAASDEAALRTVYMLALSELGTPEQRLEHIRLYVGAVLPEPPEGGV
jgi:hypothetical protein